MSDGETANAEAARAELARRWADISTARSGDPARLLQQSITTRANIMRRKAHDNLDRRVAEDNLNRRAAEDILIRRTAEDGLNRRTAEGANTASLCLLALPPRPQQAQSPQQLQQLQQPQVLQLQMPLQLPHRPHLPLQPGPQLGLHAGLQPGLQSGLPPGLQTGLPPGLLIGRPPGLQTGLQPGFQPLQPGLQPTAGLSAPLGVANALPSGCSSSSGAGSASSPAAWAALGADAVSRAATLALRAQAAQAAARNDNPERLRSAAPPFNEPALRRESEGYLRYWDIMENSRGTRSASPPQPAEDEGAGPSPQQAAAEAQQARRTELVLQALAEERLALAAPEGCSVCLEPMAQGDLVRRLPCAHLFHSECIAKWLRVRLTCPLDKLPVDDGLDMLSVAAADRAPAAEEAQLPEFPFPLPTMQPSTSQSPPRADPSTAAPRDAERYLQEQLHAEQHRTGQALLVLE